MHLRVIVANLIKGLHYKRTRFPYYSRSPNSFKLSKRYNKLNVTFRPLISVTDGLASAKLIKHYIGYYNREINSGKLTRLVANSLLLELIKKYKLKIQHVYEVPIETIRLKKNNKHVDYKETSATLKLRNRLEKYNQVLHQSNINVNISNKKKDEILDNADSLIDFSKQSYHRIFSNNSFKKHGRYYGPWWQSLKGDLRKYITINNKPTIELDYSSLHIHLLYSKQKKNYEKIFGKDSDPYELEGLDKSYRKIIKVAFLVSLNMKNKKNYVQTVSRRLEEEDLFEKNIPYKEIIKQIMLKHEIISSYFFSGIGLDLMYLDSLLTDYITGKFTKSQIPILSIHDSYIVDRKHEKQLRETMTKAMTHNKFVSMPAIKVK